MRCPKEVACDWCWATLSKPSSNCSDDWRRPKVTAASPRFEDGFMMLLHRHAGASDRRGVDAATRRTARDDGDGPVVEVHDLVRRFGSFTAVDHVSFEVQRGEVFGLLGPNGAGKTTTFRMLCGLLPASGGTLRVAGVDLRTARASARQRIGYVAQKFSLYGQLSVIENLTSLPAPMDCTGKRAQRPRRLGPRAIRAGTARSACPAGSCRADTSSVWRWPPH